MQIGVVGHRYLGDAESYVALMSHSILSNLKSKYQGVSILSGLSEGADSIVAKSALALGISVRSVIPYRRFEEEHIQKENHDHELFNERIADKIQVGFQEEDQLAYKKGMEWLAYQSHMIVAVWDGKSEGRIGGTWQTIQLGKKMEKTILHLDSVKQRINAYFNDKYSYQYRENLTMKQLKLII